MTGGQWAEAHGEAWQQFLSQKLKPCACTHPRVSNSHRAKALKQDDGEGIAPAEPAACLVCFAPIAQEVRRPAPRPGPLAHAARLLAARCLPRRGCITRTPPPRSNLAQPARPTRSQPRTNGRAVPSRACEFPRFAHAARFPLLAARCLPSLGRVDAAASLARGPALIPCTAGALPPPHQRACRAVEPPPPRLGVPERVSSRGLIPGACSLLLALCLPPLAP